MTDIENSIKEKVETETGEVVTRVWQIGISSYMAETVDADGEKSQWTVFAEM